MLKVICDNRLRLVSGLTAEVSADLIAELTYKNPQHYKLVALGYKHNVEPKTIAMWSRESGVLTLPRGAMQILRNVLSAHGVEYEVEDRRTAGDASVTGSYLDPWGLKPGCEFPPHKLVMWDHQRKIVDAIKTYQQCLLRSPTGSGKTSAVIAAIVELGVPALVIMWDSGLLKQWQERIVSELGIPVHEQGLIRGPVCRLKGITLAMQQTLHTWTDTKWDQILPVFGLVACDECFAAGTAVLMADGSLLNIEDVREGDEVAIGGKVLGTMSRWYEGSFIGIGDALATSEHPVATERGWVNAEDLEAADIVYFDPEHSTRMHRMPKEVETGQSARSVSEVSTCKSSQGLEQGIEWRSSGGEQVQGEESVRREQGSDQGCDEQTGDEGTTSDCGVDSATDTVLRSGGQGAESPRSEEGLLPVVARVAGATLPGACRLQASRCGVQGSSVGAGFVYNLETECGVYVAGGVLVHNCQRYAASTFTKQVDRLPAKYRVGVSADERRKDGKEFVIYSMFGQVKLEVSKKELVDKQLIHEVEVFVVPTAFNAPWYAESIEVRKDAVTDGKRIKTSPQNFTSLITEMQQNKARNQLALSMIKECVDAGLPTLTFTHRVDHAKMLDAMVSGQGIAGGLALGGDDWSDQFDATVAGLRDGSLMVGCGTFGKLGVGHDIPTVAAGIVVTPVHNNRAFFGQVKGRICRTSQGKQNARVIVLWDWKVFGLVPIFNMRKWNSVMRVWCEWDKRWKDVDTFLLEVKRNGRYSTTKDSPEESTIGGLFGTVR